MALITTLHAEESVRPTVSYAVAVPFTAVQLSEGSFWQSRIETNRTATIPHVFEQCDKTKRIDNFAKAGGLMEGGFEGRHYDDSDVYKIIEAAAYSLAVHPDPKLDKYLDDLIVKIAAAQEPDGYLLTARRCFARIPPTTKQNDGKYSTVAIIGKERWPDTTGSHELYCSGHLYEAAVAHFMATGKRSLLDVAIKSANLECATFGEGKRVYVPDHPEAELALVRLSEVTGDPKYLSLSKFYIDMRGRKDKRAIWGTHWADSMPLRDQTEAYGHAVCEAYLLSGATDIAMRTGDAPLRKAMETVWLDVASKRTSIIGGIGQKGEDFAKPYELCPTEKKTDESCSSIAYALWCHRMFLMTQEAKYMDAFERTLYNGFLASVSLDGRNFFYGNPLLSEGKSVRAPFYFTACCPPNIARFMASMPKYIYATKDGTLHINLFAGGAAKYRVGKADVTVAQTTNYPWDGDVRIEVSPAAPAEFEVAVRIPGWALNKPIPSDLYHYDDGLNPKVTVALNEQNIPLELSNGYVRLKRQWRKGDVISVTMDMLPRKVVTHEAVTDLKGRFAIERGPIVYCAEAIDNHGDPNERTPGKTFRMEVASEKEKLGGISIIKTIPGDGGDAMTLIPYYAWCNRGKTQMAVWLSPSPNKETNAVQP